LKNVLNCRDRLAALCTGTLKLNYVLGGVAAMGAGLFTNPVEVIKTRIQLQGELAARGSHAQPYKSVFQAFVTVAKNDGILGLQKGLAPALCFQFVINSFR